MAGNDVDVGQRVVAYIPGVVSLIGGIVGAATGNATQGVPLIGTGAASIVTEGIKDGTGNYGPSGKGAPLMATAPTSAQPQTAAPAPPAERKLSAQELLTLWKNLPDDEKKKLSLELQGGQIPPAGKRIIQDPDPQNA